MRRFNPAAAALQDGASLEELVRAWRLLLRATGEPGIAQQASAAGEVAWVMLREAGIDPAGFMRGLDDLRTDRLSH